MWSFQLNPMSSPESLSAVEFVSSVAAIEQLPPASGAEVAFVGRSNAGKSSALNAITGRRRLAFVSKTPGRTQLINFFRYASDRDLVDLPGYGYAAAADKVRAGWERLIGAYLQTRHSLCGVLLIADIRHPMGRLDRQLIEWLQPTGVPIHMLLTKSDKLSASQARVALREVRAQLDEKYLNCSAQLFSSLRKIGIVEARAVIESWLRTAEIKKPPVKGE
jgi:GTP-binding protein